MHSYYARAQKTQLDNFSFDHSDNQGHPFQQTLFYSNNILQLDLKIQSYHRNKTINQWSWELKLAPQFEIVGAEKVLENTCKIQLNEKPFETPKKSKLKNVLFNKMTIS